MLGKSKYLVRDIMLIGFWCALSPIHPWFFGSRSWLSSTSTKTNKNQPPWWSRSPALLSPLPIGKYQPFPVTLPKFNGWPLKNAGSWTTTFLLGFGNFSGTMLNFRWISFEAFQKVKASAWTLPEIGQIGPPIKFCAFSNNCPRM